MTLQIKNYDTENKVEGKTWTTQELGNYFEVLGFAAPYVIVKRRSDGKKGSLEFKHNPRIYFNFCEG